MQEFNTRKQIEIALLAGAVAYDALALQKSQYPDLAKYQFAGLIESVKSLGESIGWGKPSKGG